MSRCTRWLLLSVLAALAAVAPVVADEAAAPARNGGLTLKTPDVLAGSSLQAVAVAPAPKAPGQPVLLAQVPDYTVLNPPALLAGSQTVGFQMEKKAGGMNRHVLWTLVGAGVGFLGGLIADEDELTWTLVGAGIGFGLSYVVAP